VTVTPGPATRRHVRPRPARLANSSSLDPIQRGEDESDEADGTLPLTCAGSVSSIANLAEALEEEEEVWFTDGELRAKGRVFRSATGTWEGRSEWQFLT